MTFLLFCVIAGNLILAMCILIGAFVVELRRMVRLDRAWQVKKRPRSPGTSPSAERTGNGA